MTPGVLVREGRVSAGDPLSAEVTFPATCAGCGRCGVDERATRRIRVAWPLPHRPPVVGQRVNLVVSALGIMRACVVLFGLPLLAWLVGVFVGAPLFGEVAGVVGYLAAIVSAWAIAANCRPLERWFDFGLRVETLPADTLLTAPSTRVTAGLKNEPGAKMKLISGAPH